ncbi:MULTISPECIES: lysozyme inhibitor LprI family protein [unclassified Microcoleus]|uniref:lysozyme inhibitor LprI family protein n=1 Tax=unclassified Microcoleus TaxID=2642155 RepID=UPI0025CBDCDA|nr:MULTISPECIES: lysozyme inhibitor LprI family protein [unclassified Microcoleus]
MKGRSIFYLMLSLVFFGISTPVVLGQGRDSSASEPAVCNQPQTTPQINNCGAALYRQADRRLNEVYKQVISKLNRRDRENLIDEQLAWIQRRDASCKDPGRTGTSYPGVRDACLASETDKRTAELEKYLQK